MFGVYFFGNNDFRRILCDYGFKGHPLRKEYPLSGYYELLYDEQYTLVSYFPVEFMQEYRKFEISGV
jgi:NADH:ubiquinone oxidoreductase subunit C